MNRISFHLANEQRANKEKYSQRVERLPALPVGVKGA